MRAVAALAAAAAALAAMSAPARAGDPKREYRTVETDHFVINYWSLPDDTAGGGSMDDVARRVGVVAERAHKTLSVALDHLPDTKTLIFIADDTDSANGFASVLPRNAIQLYAVGPSSFSELDDHEDWLYALVSHEYTHILHLDTMSGAPTIYNKIFGRTWSPNQIMPRWLIEGIAVYEESKRSAGGRDRGTRFDQYIRVARHAGLDLRLDEISGEPRQFPRSNAIYVYGSHFVRYIFDRFGDDALRAMAHLGGGFAPPFAVNRQIAKVTGWGFSQLYADWMVYLRDRYSMEEQAVERRGLRVGRALTHTAEANTYKRWSPDGTQILWLQADGDTLPKIRAMPAAGDQKDATLVAQIEKLGPFDLCPDGSIIYTQARIVREIYSYNDLVRWDAGTGQTVRLTTGRRASDPAVSPDGRSIAYSESGHSDAVLAVMAAEPDAPSEVLWRGGRYDEAYMPAWSPDGKRIAFSAWREGGYRDILIIDVATKAVTELTHDRAIDMAPAWSADGKTLYFDSDRTGISNVYARDLDTGATWQVTNVFGGAFAPRPSPDGTQLVYEGAVAAGGYDLYELPIDRASWQPARDMVDDKPPAVVVRDDEARVSPPRPYRALETLSPQAWTLSLDQSGAHPVATINTGGTDAIGLHSYSLGLGVDTGTGDTNVGASYTYSGLRPGITAAMSRTLVTRGGLTIDGDRESFPEEDWGGTISISAPTEIRADSSWSLSGNYDADYYRKLGGPTVPLDPNQRVPVLPLTDYLESGIGVRLGYSNVRTVTFGVGPYTGFDASTSLRVDSPIFGSKFSDFTASYGFDIYQNLGSSRSMAVLHVGGAVRAGDLIHGGGFGLGGIPPQQVAQSILDSTRASSIGYLRGYPINELVGNQYALANFEYRQEVLRIEHGLDTLPVYLRRFQIAALVDSGTAFNGPFNYTADVRTAIGGALRLDVLFGYFVPGTFEIGYSRGIDKDGVGESWFLLTGSL